MPGRPKTGLWQPLRNVRRPLKLSPILPCVITSRRCKGQLRLASYGVFSDAMCIRRALLVLLAFLAVLPAAMLPEDAPAVKPLSPAARKWVDETFARLSTEEKIGQLVFPTYFGAFESTESHDFKELMSRVEDNHIGGFILATRSGPRGIEL